jgi:hypothetical protein
MPTDPLKPDTKLSISSLVKEVLAGAQSGPAGTTTPPKPVPAGTVGTAIPIAKQTFQQLFLAAATQNNSGSVIWSQDGNELIVTTGKVTVDTDDGLVLVTIPVSCDQAANTTIQVPFAVGSVAQPAGLVAVTEERPRGPAVVVDVWAEALTAFAWRELLTVLARVAAQAGVDEDGAGLVPIALIATKDGVTILPMARHTFDRVLL